MYDAFGAVCLDEEAFRIELKRYAGMKDPRVTPAQIPPLVPQHMLRPTSANKMRNAVVTYRNFGGELSESTIAPSDNGLITQNNQALLELIADQQAVLRNFSANTNRGYRKLQALTLTFTTERLIDFLNAYCWYDSKSSVSKNGNPAVLQVDFLKGNVGNHEIKDWLLLGPKISKSRGTLHLAGADFDVVYRSRREGSDIRFNTYNDPSHRMFAAHICCQEHLEDANEELDSLRDPHRGVMLYYPITDEEAKPTAPNSNKPPKPAKSPFTVGFTLLFPRNGIRRTLTFSVLKKDQPEEAIVTAD